jgi:hypothetical protein
MVVDIKAKGSSAWRCLSPKLEGADSAESNIKGPTSRAKTLGKLVFVEEGLTQENLKNTSSSLEITVTVRWNVRI